MRNDAQCRITWRASVQDITKEIPGPVLRRLPRYLTLVREMKKSGRVWVSSQNLAQSLGLTMSTVRQDISHLALSGVSKRGYEVERLEKALGDELGADTVHRVAIVGAGLLGQALALHGDLAEHRFITSAIFDNSPDVIGKAVGHLHVRPMEDLKRLVRQRRVEIGIISVPAAAAQKVSDHLVEAGVRGLLNLAHAHLTVPSHVHLVEARFIARLQQLAYAIRSDTPASSQF